jgi:hypothetical protein
MAGDGSVRPEPLVDVEEVARAVVYMAGLPLDANGDNDGTGEDDAVRRARLSGGRWLAWRSC